MKTTFASWTTGVRLKHSVTRAPRLELEQAGLRLAVGVVVLVVLLLRLISQSKPSAELSQMVWFLAGFVAFAVAITLWILAGPQVSATRRILGIVADNATITSSARMLQRARDVTATAPRTLAEAAMTAYRSG